MSNKFIKIQEEKNVFDDNLLNVIGNSFAFDHVKGLSEWLKNSVDAYKRSNIADRDQCVYFRFTDGSSESSLLECIDFIGMSEVDIEKALKRWFDPEASKRGIKSLKTFGGHGNGGKFYMRQMFKTSHYITYKDGLLSVFGFSENQKYGFAEGLKNKTMSPSDALEYANLDQTYISKGLKEKVLSGKTGFTVVRGVSPKNMPKMIKAKTLVSDLVAHPQSQRILDRIPAKVIYNEKVLVSELKGEKLAPYPGFEQIDPIEIPEKLIYETHSERVEVTLSDNKYPAGSLKLFTSAIPLQRGSKNSEMNRIDVLGEIGVIGSYKLYELGSAGHMSQSAFVYGEVECFILEDPSQNAVQNDRSKLAENPTTKALLGWVDAQVLELCKRIAEKDQQERAEKMKDISSYLNSYLNQWKDKFMTKILATVLAGEGTGTGGGTGGEGGNGGTPGGEGGGGGGGNAPTPPGPDGGGDGGGGSEPKKQNRSPKVLLSSQDKDPFEPYGDVILSPRDPAVYQRFMDVDQGIYWINTSAPLAESILNKFGQDSARWRDYLFQRYVDIIVKEALAQLKKDPAEFTYSNVENKIDGIILEIHRVAADDLSSFLFEDTFKTEE